MISRRYSNALMWSVMALALCGSAAGQPALTTIDDTLYKADGSPFEGVLMINWRSFEGPETVNIPTNSLTSTVRGGRLHVRLVPTTTAPRPAYYSVRYVATGSVQFTELWSVPPSDVPVRIRDIQIDWPPTTAGTATPVTDITISDVEGLSEALDQRPEKGQSFAPSRAAVIGPAGDIEAATGKLTDCIRVDGASAPCGFGEDSPFVDNEIPAGSVNGSNASFTLEDAPNPALSLFLYRNGLLQKQELDYTLAAETVVFDPLAIPQPGDILLASYRVHPELTSSLVFVDRETPSGIMNGTNNTLSLANSPNPAASLVLYRNGMLLRLGTDYTVSGKTIIFQGVSIPQAGDALQAFYRLGGL